MFRKNLWKFTIKRKIKSSAIINKEKVTDTGEFKSYLETDKFSKRHIGLNAKDEIFMLNAIGYKTLDELCDYVIPKNIRLFQKLNLDSSLSEHELFNKGKLLAEKNQVWRSYIGAGYYNCFIPAPIFRNVFENPGWTTSYTPYQCEIAQGRLECLFNFQTMISELTGLDLANASLLDEGTAAAESMILFYRKNNRKNLFLSDTLHWQTIRVIETRAKSLGLQVIIGNTDEVDFSKKDFAGALIQYPDTNGEILDYSDFVLRAHQEGTYVACATDLLSLCIIKSTAEFDIDIAIGSSQRFGIPLGYGGPHAAFFACKKSMLRMMPGRLVGITRDANKKVAFRLTLQTREQHIKRDKATSNICTAQALLANMAVLYAIYHGPSGLKNIASRVHLFTCILRKGLINYGTIQNTYFFDTIKIKPKDSIGIIKKRAELHKINFRYFPDQSSIGISLDETITFNDIQDIFHIFGCNSSIEDVLSKIDLKSTILNSKFCRKDLYLTQPVFNNYHTETKLIRYMKMLENKDISLVHSMIPLGSCTMKLNGTTEMNLCSLSGFSNIHPFVPKEQVVGYKQLIDELEKDLCIITGFDKISFQPNSGSQGEYAGLFAIRSYHEVKGEGHRNICLIPVSAHGTNAASAKLVGMNVQPVLIANNGEINMDDLKEKINKFHDEISCLMITYPSTNGIFEEKIVEICDLIHKAGGQIYLDGANMNAQVGLCRPADYGADVSHLNLHKTFCIPHGGGGPGVGPVALKSHLIPYLPDHMFSNENNKLKPVISSAPFGSALILPISWAYIKMMGFDGLKKSSEIAILNANYMCKKLEPHYKVLYTNKEGLVAHEFILDVREFKNTADIEVIDIAKRLMDYGFHAPTISWPVPGTIMIEPTESEDKEEIDRFCESLISIRQEISEIENNYYNWDNNLLKNAPHTKYQISSDKWNKPYTRQRAGFPLPFVKQNKIWPTVARADDVFGDKNIVCTCPSVT